MVGLSGKKTKRKGSLRGVLKTSSSPEQMKRPLSLSGTEEMMFLEGMHPSFSSSPALSDSLPAPKVIERTKMEEKVRWDWKMMFKKIAADLAQCFDQRVKGTMKRTLEAEHQLWGSSHSIETSAVRQDLWGGKLDYPKCISKSVSEFMAELDLFLPFARTGAEGPLHFVRTAFIDITNLCLKNFHVQMSKMSLDIPRKAPLTNLYILLSGASYIRNHLLHYETVLASEDPSKKLFSVLYRQFVELVDTLTKLVKEVHNNLISTSILHDTESYNWTDSKDFYEGERCSFPVQMWNFYLRGLKADLWRICPPHQAQSMYSSILCDSLQILTHRYVQVKPSFRRTVQLRSDIVSLLLCMSDLLLPACNSVSQYLDVSHSQMPHYTIHNLCSTLLSVMAVVTTPLDVLYRVYKRGFTQKQVKGGEEHLFLVQDSRGCNTHWLSWIQHSTLQPPPKDYFDMQTTTALYLHVQLLLSQPEVNWCMVVQAMIMKDYTLPILFLTQAMASGTPEKSSASGAKASASKSDSIKPLFQSVLWVLSQCSDFPDAVIKVILPVINRCNDLAILESKTVIGRDCQVPVWLETLFNLLKPFLHRVLKPVLNFMLTQVTAVPSDPFLKTALTELPCGCPSHNSSTSRHEKHKKSEGGKDMIDTALRLLLKQLAEDIYTFPSSMCILFKGLQDHCSSRGLKTPHNCVGLKILATAIRCRLSDSAYIESVTGLPLNQVHKDNLTVVSDCAYHILVTGKGKSPGTPRIAGQFCKENKEWVTERLRDIITYLTSEMFDLPDGTVLEGATTEYSDQLFTMLASEILDTRTGYEDLTNIYNLIANNRRWLQTHLDIQPVLPPVDASPMQTFSLNLKAAEKTEFYPTKEFAKIGDCKFNHAAILEFSIDWLRLLRSDLGLSEFGFRSLLYNRHEMQDGAYLEEGEKHPVDNLKSLFDNEPRELG